MGLLTETNAQYYSGQQSFNIVDNGSGGSQVIFDVTYNTPLISAFDISGNRVASNSNYTIYIIDPTQNSPIAVPEAWSYISGPNGSQVTCPPLSTSGVTTGQIVIQLKTYATQNNYGNYEYISLNDVVDNFLVGYVGPDNVIPSVRRTNVLFHAKRGLQEFSYDTLKSIKSQEVTIPPSLSLPIPQDYVNYVKIAWIDQGGVERIIYPTTLTSNPTNLPIQDNTGIPMQDMYGENLDANQSLEETRWADQKWDWTSNWQSYPWGDYWGYYPSLNWYGRMYGLSPETAQRNGWFTINERTGMFSFSSDLAGLLINIHYISDGLASDEDTKIPKMAEQAMYMHIAYSLLSTRRNIPEYIVQRFKRDRSSALRNAKIRLQNLKLGELTQVMRGKSKWIKH
tara:strand:+ start:10451 stop:11641 length:1191 start_codon:yes stop_codon:yes gene_type:complete